MADILARLRDRQPLQIVCMGDSITAGTGLPERDRQRYAVLMQDLLRRWLGTEAIACESRAVGGAKSTDIRAWVPRDFVGAAPDLLTLWIGYNDKSNAFTRDYFKRSVLEYIDRVCRATHGQTAILLLATGPGCGPRFTMMDDYAEAIREIGRERGLTVFDMHAHLKAIGREELQGFYGDMAHPNEDGHRLIAEALCEFLVRAAGIDTPKPVPPPVPQVTVGDAHAWDFEAGLQDWTLDSPEISLDADRAASGRQALRFHLQEAGKDHRRALSPALPAIPGQRYDISAKVFPEGEPAGAYGLYVMLHASPDGSDRYTAVLPVKGRALVPGAWSPWAGRVQIPEGAGSFRVMFWAERGTVAAFRVDDITVTPVAP
ncbi:MAG: SGNH/GDSL hydrolase family protein [Lentisphaerae bacterium]|nr:SGNH/GDSL hydrolase family protein [Lentisphaerota bacterium]